MKGCENVKEFEQIDETAYMVQRAQAGSGLISKKKVILAISCVLAVILALLLWHIYSKLPKNVFDQIYWEVKKAEYKQDSVLLSGTDSAEARYDRNLFTFDFAGISIPDLDMDIFEHDGYLHITFIQYNEYGQDASTHFVYNPNTKKLYGEQSMQYLVDNFLVHYFGWWADAGKENRYSCDDLGKFTFIASEKAWVEIRLDDSQ